MTKSFILKENEYRFKDLNEEGKEILSILIFSVQSLHELNSRYTLMTKAKNAYISDLKKEVIEKKSGIDLGALFDED